MRGEWTAFAIMNIVWTMHNQVVAGNPTGAQNESGNCALGGTVDITGTTGVGGDIQTNNLDYQLNACGHSSSSYDYSITLSGLVNQNGTFGYYTGDPISMSFSSNSISIVGTVYGGEAVSDTCTFTSLESSSGTSGSICGRSFSY